MCSFLKSSVGHEHEVDGYEETVSWIFDANNVLGPWFISNLLWASLVNGLGRFAGFYEKDFICFAAGLGGWVNEDAVMYNTHYLHTR